MASAGQTKQSLKEKKMKSYCLLTVVDVDIESSYKIVPDVYI